MMIPEMNGTVTICLHGKTNIILLLVAEKIDIAAEVKLNFTCHECQANNNMLANIEGHLQNRETNLRFAEYSSLKRQKCSKQMWREGREALCKICSELNHRR
ncbi:hypothetical protein HHI36_024067 [Cryptolaemus montrouzieri]|uniref:Uncharacterized protein n=1 Tax=Cryptolaemus montrouzieri TaxID=559131 RepID=A0ABD2N0Z1_9CUCU